MYYFGCLRIIFVFIMDFTGFSADKFRVAYEKGDVKIYVPNNATDYHASRFQEAMRLSAYAGAGIDEDLLRKHCEYVIELCNSDSKTVKTDIAGIMNSLLARMKYPIDVHCSMRMGILLSFIEYREGGELFMENPYEVLHHYLGVKERLALSDGDLYSFFLTWGISNIPRYDSHLSTLDDLDYFQNRMMKVRSLLREEDYRKLYNS